ncbi:BON domain-containing protein [Halonatronum saccharophilum]|uniref:BON domain-containing protein n=1 Tax=Halonatronum saccharophilum TaxID=150060 RepID=UPI003CCB9744
MAISISTDGAIDDEDVQMEVGEELAMDPKLKGKVGVKSIKGVAHLMGNVESKELKKIATKTASKARGVTEVVNEIKVGDNKEEDLFHTQVRNDDDG